MGWIDGGLLGFDTETTGVTPTQERLVTAALVWRPPVENPGTADAVRPHDYEKTWLADPGVPIPEQASRVHGITTEVAQRDGRPVEEVLEEVASELASAMKAHVPIVAFNATYDLTLMECELARHGMPTIVQRCGGELGPIIDPLVIDRKVDRWRKGKRRLADMCAAYHVTTGENLHTAEVDVTATLDVLEAICRTHQDFSAIPLKDLNAWQENAHREWATGFNDWLARSKPDSQPTSLKWPLVL
ncbi:exonuclease domain-containing protein [Actinomyces vulturis]|uniref:exonuclease domain-containing protein n=1 Tax=Actinomyces vulturis TaxID=1857645 RepID=UPI00082B2B19|nr:exonuclease domain-containing protein [Actinomyces vulturis]